MDYEERVKKSEEVTDKLVARLNKLSAYERVSVEQYSRLKDLFLNSILKVNNPLEYEKRVGKSIEISDKDVIRLNKLSAYERVNMSKYLEIFFKHLRNISNQSTKKDESEESKVISELKKEIKYAIFITHSVKDKKLAGMIKNIFDDLGVSAFVAHDDIEKGKEWKPEIINSLNNSNFILVLCTKNIESSPWVNFEVGLGYKKIFPIFLEELSDKLSYIKDMQGVKIYAENLEKSILEIVGESLKKAGLKNIPTIDFIKTNESCIKLKDYLEELTNIKKPSLNKGTKDGL